MEARAQAWTDARDRVEGLVRDATEEQLATLVPACPDWTVRDLFGHVVGVGVEHARAADAGRDLPVHDDAWAAETVASRRGADLETLAREWAGVAPGIVTRFDDGTDPGLIVDLGIHEQDLRGALGTPGARDSAADGFVVAALTERLGAAVEQAGVPALRIVTGDGEFVVGGAEPAATLTVDRFEFWRALTGRRSEAQVRAWGWDTDPTPYLEPFALFGAFRDTDLVE